MPLSMSWLPAACIHCLHVLTPHGTHPPFALCCDSLRTSLAQRVSQEPRTSAWSAWAHPELGTPAAGRAPTSRPGAGSPVGPPRMTLQAGLPRMVQLERLRGTRVGRQRKGLTVRCRMGRPVRVSRKGVHTWAGKSQMTAEDGRIVRLKTQSLASFGFGKPAMWGRHIQDHHADDASVASVRRVPACVRPCGRTPAWL